MRSLIPTICSVVVLLLLTHQRVRGPGGVHTSLQSEAWKQVPSYDAYAHLFFSPMSLLPLCSTRLRTLCCWLWHMFHLAFYTIPGQPRSAATYVRDRSFLWRLTVFCQHIHTLYQCASTLGTSQLSRSAVRDDCTCRVHHSCAARTTLTSSLHPLSRLSTHKTRAELRRHLPVSSVLHKTRFFGSLSV